MDKGLPRIYIVRHGQTLWSLQGRHTGTTDIPLTKKGEEQAGYLKKYLSRKKFVSVLSSPLQRSLRTCEIAGYKNICEVRNELKEWNYGNYEGIKTSEIKDKMPSWNLFEHGCPNGETIQDVEKRADVIISEIRNRNGDILIFSHGHFLRIFALRWIGIDTKFAKNILLGTAAMSVLGYDHNLNEPAMLLWNDMDQMALDLYM